MWILCNAFLCWITCQWNKYLSMLMFAFVKRSKNYVYSYISIRSKVVWLWKSGRMATLISNHNNRLTMELRQLGHFYYGNNCLLYKLLRVWKEKKAHRQSENGLFLPSENSKSPRYSSSWPPLNYSPRDLVIIQTYCCILCL